MLLLCFINKNIQFKDDSSDGLNQIIVGYADRSVRIFSWSNASSALASSAASSAKLASYVNPFQENGEFVLTHSWELPELVCNMSKV